MYLPEATNNKCYSFIKQIFPLAANTVIFWFAGIFQTIAFRKSQVLKVLVLNLGSSEMSCIFILQIYQSLPPTPDSAPAHPGERQIIFDDL